MIERIPISSRDQWLALRRQDVTASVVAAIPGLHPYLSALHLFHQKRYGLDVVEDETMAMRRGRLLEASFPALLAEERPDWTIRKATEYLRDPGRRLGGTPDFYFTDETGRRGVLQAKTCSKWVFDRHWGDSPPTWIAVQNAVEIMLDDADLGCVMVMIVDGYHFGCRLFEVPRHVGAEARIRSMVAEFWQAVEAGTPPKTDYERDADLIALMYPAEVKGKVVDLRGDNRLPGLLVEREALMAAVKAAEARKDQINTELKEKIGDAESALIAGDWQVTLKTQARKGYVVEDNSFRVLRVKPPPKDEATAA